MDHIAFLIHYINGDVEDTSDDIIRDSILYDYICRILDQISDSGEIALNAIANVVETVTDDYVEPFAGARERLNRALEVIVVTYYSAVLKGHAAKLLETLGA